MTLLHRVLDPRPCLHLGQYLDEGGGRGLEIARRLGPDGIIDEVEAAGLRGRGGAGFSTGRKWRTVAASGSPAAGSTVVVNGAEGEPGTFKDRALLRSNPFKVVEGALIAAHAIDAAEVIFCLKHSFHRELLYLRRAIAETEAAGWAARSELRVVEGPSSYLFGEETALLEVIGGRQPFPRVDPPFRRGVDAGGIELGHSVAMVHLAGPGGTDAAPALVNNVETIANVTGILRHGADWYRSVGTTGTPGTAVCTVTGHTRRHGVAEFAMGTSLEEVISVIGAGVRGGGDIVGVLSGVANPLIPADRIDTPLGFDEMREIGSGLGAGGFIVFGEGTDLLAVAQGVARFLAVESCGQCEPCKRDGLAIARQLTDVRAGHDQEHTFAAIRDRLSTVTRGARCALATQQDQVVGSILDLFTGDQLRSRSDDARPASASLVLPIVDIVGGRAVLDTSQLTKQPDWSHSARDSGRWPATVLSHQPVTIHRPAVPEDDHSPRLDAVVTHESVGSSARSEPRPKDDREVA
jgi:NADH:ubiquinone oxidoreductase subunit F (NADH-binding)